jgi:hypothetical protein
MRITSQSKLIKALVPDSVGFDLLHKGAAPQLIRAFDQRPEQDRAAADKHRVVGLEVDALLPQAVKKVLYKYSPSNSLAIFFSRKA